MKKRVLLPLFLLLLMTVMAPAAFAANELTVGGYIRLSEDVYLKERVVLTQDTVLDLNGYTIDGDNLWVSEGVTLLFKNGTMKANLLNSGECRIENTTFFRGCINNRGYISAIRDCTMEYGSICVNNHSGGVIDLIENCDIKSKQSCAVQCSGDKEISRIECIRNCRLQADEREALSDSGGTIGRVEDCILVGELAGQSSSGGVEELVNCVVVGMGEFAVLQEELVQSKYRDCVLISEKWEGAMQDGFLGGWDEHNRWETPEPYYEEEELLNKENCTFLLLEDIKLDKYTSWEMKKPAGLSGFAAVNTYTAGQFADVASNYWGAANIAKAYELGLMKGSSPSAFDPEGSVTVAQTITMAARLHSIYTTGTENFVQSGTWYQTYVDYCKENGILARDFDDYNAPAQRGDFAVILAAALPAEALGAINTVSSIPDVAPSDENADAIYTLYRSGILTGNDAAGTFGPETSINRAAAAAILTRMADPTLRKQITLWA